jgi:hypothetical protein
MPPFFFSATFSWQNRSAGLQPALVRKTKSPGSMLDAG